MRPLSATCTSCGGTSVHRANVKSAFWHEEQLVVVEDIPALLCDSCGEQFYDDTTVVLLDLLRANGLQAGRARREVVVPVFSFGDGPGTAGGP